MVYLIEFRTQEAKGLAHEVLLFRSWPAQIWQEQYLLVDHGGHSEPFGRSFLKLSGISPFF